MIMMNRCVSHCMTSTYYYYLLLLFIVLLFDGNVLNQCQSTSFAMAADAITNDNNNNNDNNDNNDIIDDYLFLIWYERSDTTTCVAEIAVVLQGFVPNESTDFKGGFDTTFATCAKEASCQLDPTKDSCFDELDEINQQTTSTDTSSSSSSVTTTISMEPVLFADGTLTDQQSSLLFNIKNGDNDGDVNSNDNGNSNKCHVSSIYRHCEYQMVTWSQFKQNANEYVQNPSNYFYIKDHVYMIFYNDETCSNAIGIQGIVPKQPFSYPTTTTTKSNDISAMEAMACIYNPNGTACQKLLMQQEEQNNNDITMVDIVAQIDKHEHVHVQLDHGDTCLVMTPDHCLPSPICTASTSSSSTGTNNCFYRIATAPTFLSNPDSFLQTTSTTTVIQTDLISCPVHGILGGYYYDEKDSVNKLVILLVVIFLSLYICVYLATCITKRHQRLKHEKQLKEQRKLSNTMA